MKYLNLSQNNNLLLSARLVFFEVAEPGIPETNLKSQKEDATESDEQAEKYAEQVALLEEAGFRNIEFQMEGKNNTASFFCEAYGVPATVFLSMRGKMAEISVLNRKKGEAFVRSGAFTTREGAPAWKSAIESAMASFAQIAVSDELKGKVKNIIETSDGGLKYTRKGKQASLKINRDRANVKLEEDLEGKRIAYIPAKSFAEATSNLLENRIV